MLGEAVNGELTLAVLPDRRRYQIRSYIMKFNEIVLGLEAEFHTRDTHFLGVAISIGNSF